MRKRIGLFVCWCGFNIAGTVDVQKVVETLSKYPNVVIAIHHQYMCSEPGQKMIKEAISEHKLDGIIIAACTHTLHENTYMKLAASVNLNPYQVEIANIREHCSWVHADKRTGTEKAVRIIKSVVDKLVGDISLSAIKIPVTKKVLVVGGGISGMQTAIDIGNSGYDVILLDRKPSVGGRMAQLSETFPTLDCTQCIMTPKMVEVGQHPKIKLMTYSEIEDVSGYVGNFNVKIRTKPTYVDWTKCTGCGDCLVQTLSPEEMSAPLPLRVGRVAIDDVRCIQCGECVRACLKENGTNALTSISMERDMDSYISRLDKKEGVVFAPTKKLKEETSLIEKLRMMGVGERRSFWRDEFSRCIKCYGCRKECPVWTTYDTSEIEKKESLLSGLIPPDLLHHISRAFVIADTCVGCGECERVCPAKIPLRTLHSLVGNKPENVFEFLPEIEEVRKEELRDYLASLRDMRKRNVEVRA